MSQEQFGAACDRGIATVMTLVIGGEQGAALAVWFSLFRMSCGTALARGTEWIGQQAFRW